MKNNKAKVVTFGCRLNIYESEIIKEHAENARLTNAFIFNTCAVTAEATRQAKQSIRRTRRNNPDASIIVTGCAAQIDPQQFSNMAEVDQVFGNEEKLNVQSYEDFGVSTSERVAVNDIMSIKKTAPHLILKNAHELLFRYKTVVITVVLFVLFPTAEAIVALFLPAR